MDLGIRGRVALVTGTSSGIGKAIALALAAEGVRLALIARRRELLDDVAAQARAAGAADARGYAVDLNDGVAVGATLRRVASDLGAVEILVANSGGPKAGTFAEVTLDDWDAGYRGVLRGMLELVNGVLPAMRASGWGRIVALTSSSVKQPIPNLVLSNSFRVALVAALKTLSLEVARDGVTINAIATGRVMTDRLRHLYPDEAAMQAAAKQDIPAQHVATPEEFAPMAVFLCSHPARYVTGQTIAVDGGLIKSLF
jgi:3-oxoacyl-[acyl-carrier protein] reductase